MCSGLVLSGPEAASCLGRSRIVARMSIPARLLLAAALLAGAGCAGRDASRAPNVLFLLADDLAAHALGSYGNDQARTPSIDALAARGVRFTRAYAQFPACGPSRVALMTGLYPETLGITSNPGALRLAPALGERPTLPGLFRHNGWHTARVSKIFHMEVPHHIRSGAHGADHEGSWSERHSIRAPEWKTAGERVAMLPWGRKATRDVYYANVFSMVRASGNGSNQVDALAADTAIDILDQRADQRFFLAVGLVRPHLPFVAPARFFDDHPAEGIHLPERVEADWEDIPAIGIPLHSEGTGLTSDDRKRQTIAAYHASVSFMDAQVGRILAALDERGLRDDTLIVFTSDHGYHLGEHDFWGKGSLREESTRVPLIIAGPGIAASQTDALAQLVDVFPTLVELAGLEAPPHLQGRSLVPVLRDPAARVNEEIHAMVPRGDLLRGERWAYISWRDGTAELFDMQNDPRQFTNLAQRSESGDVLARMRRRLDRMLAEIAPAS
jgi:iduronate 2-sulfatase